MTTGINETAETLHQIVAKGAMPPLVLMVDDCRATYKHLIARGSSGEARPCLVDDPNTEARN